MKHAPGAAATARSWRVACLEDDAQLREGIIIPGLRYYGFAVTGAGTAAELYRLMIGQAFDMVVLDIGLPDEDGLSVVTHLREVSSVGIVMLTGNSSRQDYLEALGNGADAFLAKPVDVETLAATLNSLARRLTRAPPTSPPVAARPGWQLDTNDWCLVGPGGKAIALTAPERCTLRHLVDANGEAVSRETLIAALASDVYDFDPHRLEMMVHRLRRKAQDATGEPLPLLTSRGKGYLFVSEP
ncbi:DNA-binding response OmpR family regulator [Luteibacter sp. OK325]|uniref:response regulator transcription factor n=1 Tax=Luteibacter sp. OK325 TaxID=2135670 RepID=UPI000D35BE42|nr:response regulator transcription factor [Luteibacter sp. OK325]PTR35202.1 DNA-binding response OmpR family regulator [Luteibacter sp. OK325]